MKRLLWLPGWLLLALVLLPAAVLADVWSPGLRIRWVGERPAPAAAGAEITGRFELVAGRGGILEDVTLSGAGWTVTALAGEKRAVMATGSRRPFTFRAVPGDAQEPLVVRATFDGRVVQKVLRLDAASLERATRPRPIVFGAEPALTGPKRHATAAQTIRFKGRFLYLRGDMPTPLALGADNITVRIWDDDSPDPFDEVIWEGITDPQGRFDVTVHWDDGVDDPDVYIEVVTACDAVDVQANDTFETTYSWSSADDPIDDFQGSFIDFGDLGPAPGEDGAVHVYTSMVRARRYASTEGGMNPPLLDVQWPSDDRPSSYYDPDWQEIHITTLRTWNEGTHIHEFGHFLDDMHGGLLPFTYENPGGHCDNPPPPTHCVWCPESDIVGWQEGWPNWFAWSLMSRWSTDYGIQPWAISDTRFAIETPSACGDGTFYASPLTENYVAALLWDIEDANPTPLEDHDGGSADCDVDALSLGADEIFTIIREDNPGTALAFRDQFRLRYHEHDQDFWSTARNVDPSFAFPTPVPVVLAQPEDCAVARAGDTFSLGVQGNGSQLKYQWRINGAPLFDGGGITGTNSPTLVFSPAPAHMSGTYTCLVSTCNESLSVLSLPAHVTIQSDPAPRPLVSWGGNSSGTVADGSFGTSPRPPGMRSISPVIAVDGGHTFSAALHADGTVSTWGYPAWGVELGNGYSTTTRPTPAVVAGLDSVMQIVTGTLGTLVLRRDGRVWGWGYNGYGEIGDSTTINRAVPVLAREVEGCVKAIARGNGHSLALLEDGTVQAWGLNFHGQLGRGFTSNRELSPAIVPGLTGVIAISAAGNGSMALRSDGTVWTWGQNWTGQLGDGSSTDRHSPVPVAGLTAVRAIRMGERAGFAIRNDGSCWSWGSNQNGLLGDGSWPGLPSRNVPGLMPNLVNPLRIDASDGSWCLAQMPDGAVVMWGYNDQHLLGRPTPNSVPTPAPVANTAGAGPAQVSAIGTGYTTAYAFGYMSDVLDAGPATPRVLALRATPNPSLASTRLRFDLPHPGRVSLAVYDVAGRRVRSLVDEFREPGRYDLDWDGRDESGGARLAGVYFARIELNGMVLTERLVRIR